VTEQTVEYPIDGMLDLHQFRPADVADVVGDYLDACKERGIWEVRVIHGKGIGTLREIVHAVLRRRSDVVNYELASDGSGWGATVVTLDRGS
jgi:DNA-nicking Smr family endonuclease